MAGTPDDGGKAPGARPAAAVSPMADGGSGGPAVAEQSDGTAPAMPVQPSPAPTLVQASLNGLCPRCGAKTLFAGTARFAERCGACGLDFTRFNVGDGPAAFLTLILGFLVVGLAMWLQLALAPPWWVHVILWVPLTLALVLLGLRLCKAGLLYTEYANNAAEARNRSGE